MTLHVIFYEENQISNLFLSIVVTIKLSKKKKTHTHTQTQISHLHLRGVLKCEKYCVPDVHWLHPI
jgi:hypothetical protein